MQIIHGMLNFFKEFTYKWGELWTYLNTPLGTLVNGFPEPFKTIYSINPLVLIMPDFTALGLITTHIALIFIILCIARVIKLLNPME